MERLSSGIYGLDRLIGGGYGRNTVNGVLGGSGTGKTIFGIQFLLNGLHSGEDAFFISLEERPEKLIEEAKAMGFPEIEEFIAAKKLIIKHAGVENVREFMESYLPSLVEDYTKGSELGVGLRVFIDPLTPLLWELKDRSEQRELLSNSFHNLREVGTTLVSIEESGSFKGLRFTEETAVPIYLCDTIVHLRYKEIGGGVEESRTLRVQKFRSSEHGEGIYPFAFIPGLGITLTSVEEEITTSKRKIEITTYENIFNKTIDRIRKNAPPELADILLLRVDEIKRNWSSYKSPKEVVDEFCRMYGV